MGKCPIDITGMEDKADCDCPYWYVMESYIDDLGNDRTVGFCMHPILVKGGEIDV